MQGTISPKRHDGRAHYRTRSVSPVDKPQSRQRSRSPKDRRRKHEHRSGQHAESAIKEQKKLPFRAQELRKQDLERFYNLFALYLDVQKQLDVAGLQDKEVKGRWKSFIRKWNDGDLAEGWYDPETKQKADAQAASHEQDSSFSHARRREEGDEDEYDDDDEDVGPALPGHIASASRSGPAVPNSQDLRYRDEIIAANRSEDQKHVRYQRHLERQEQKERLDELVPRAEAGTRERQLEKKKDAAAARAAYRETRSPGAEDVREGDLMGDDGIDAYRRKKLEEEKKKTERQIRKEEIWRARAEERREKLREMQEKEDKTMDMLRALAKQRYG